MAPTLLSTCLCAAVAGGAQAFWNYVEQIPNGAAVQYKGAFWLGVGHVTAGGGGARNAFGEAFAQAGHQWTPELCAEDSDGDGQSNGLELGDPYCQWVEGEKPFRTNDISHPGFNDSTTAAGAAATNATSNESLADHSTPIPPRALRRSGVADSAATPATTPASMALATTAASSTSDTVVVPASHNDAQGAAPLFAATIVIAALGAWMQ